jgi:Uma2 family endonuclease
MHLLDSTHEERSVDNFVYLDATWSEYESIVRIRGARRKPKLVYADGVLELMSPSSEHQVIGWTLGRLVEVWCDEHDIDFTTVGSRALKSRRAKRALDPDVCYALGDNAKNKKARPDLAIEVIWASGGIDKRALYDRFRVPEVWFWRNGQISVFAWRTSGYRKIKRSRLLPGINLAELVSFVGHVPTSRGLRAYRAAVQSGRSMGRRSGA